MISRTRSPFWLVLVLALAGAAGAETPAPRASHDIERYLQFRSAIAPAFSPDGSEVAFLSAISGSNQVWCVPVSGGWPEQWTFFKGRVSLVRWSPADRDTLIVGKDTDGNERTQLYRISHGGREVVALTDRPESIFRFGHFSDDGSLISYSSNKRDPKSFDVYVMELSTRTEKLVHQGDGDHSAGRFSSDGRRMVVIRNNGGGDDRILIADVAGNGAAEDVTPVSPAKYRDVNWSASGRSLLLLTDAGKDFIGLARLSLAGGGKGLTFLHSPPRDVEHFHYLRPIDSAVITTVADGFSELSGVKLERTGMPEVIRIELPEHAVVSDVTYDPGGNNMALVLSAADRVPDVWVAPAGGEPRRRLTKSSMAGLSPDDMAVPALARYKSFDGLEIPAFLYLPKGAVRDGNLPAVIHIHGGPEGQTRPTLSPVVQYLVNRGYAVLEPNVRGSTGYGKTYEHLDDVRKRLDSVKDIAAAADWLRGNGWVHPKRIAVMGGSYGGFMVLAAVTHLPEQDWAAAVDLYGIADFEAFLRNTGPYRRKLREAEYGSLEKDLEFFRQISPIHRVDKIRAPLMVIQGSNDPRVPQSESDAIVAKLRELKRPVEYLLFPDEGHGIVKTNNRVKAYRGIADFLDKHVKNRE